MLAETVLAGALGDQMLPEVHDAGLPTRNERERKDRKDRKGKKG